MDQAQLSAETLQLLKDAQTKPNGDLLKAWTQ